MSDEKNKGALGSWVHELRRSRGWTQKTLAAEAGLTERTIQRVEAGEVPGIGTLRSLAEAFELSVERLAGIGALWTGGEDDGETVATEVVVLVAEDSAADRLLMQRAWEHTENPGRLSFVEDGEDALAYLGRGEASPQAESPRPRLILLDIDMPKLNGDEVLRVVKGHEDLRKIPVVVFTSSAAPQDIDRCYELGASAFVTKPHSFDALVQIMGSLATLWLR